MPPMATIDIGGLPVSFQPVDPERAAVISQLLGDAPPHAGEARVVISYRRRRPQLPGRRPDHEYLDLRVWHCGDELVLQTPADVRAHVGRDAAWIGGDADDLDGAFQSLFHFAITHLLAHEDRFVLHGAAVAHRGVAVVAIGPTGSGKSTLALAALSAGWQVLADDLVVVRMRDGRLEVTGVPRRPAMPGDLPATPAGELLPDDQRGRRRLPPGSLVGGWFPLVAVVLVGHSAEAEGALAPMAAEDTLLRVIGSFSSSTDPRHLARFFPVAGAVSRLPGWELLHGAHPSSRLSVAQSALERIAATSPG